MTFRQGTFLNLRHDWTAWCGERDRSRGPHESWVSYSKTSRTGRSLEKFCNGDVEVCNYGGMYLHHGKRSTFIIQLLFLKPSRWSIVRSISKIRPYCAKRHFWLSLCISMCLIDSRYFLLQFAWHVAYRSCLRIPPSCPHAWISKLFNEYDYH